MNLYEDNDESIVDSESIVDYCLANQCNVNHQDIVSKVASYHP